MCSELVKSKKILICATGSVAAIKIPQIITGIEKLSEKNLQIRFVPTAHALHFLPNLRELAETGLEIEIFKDEDEWSNWKKRGDPVLHIELRKWADILVIAPLDANTLAKLANGLCDNLLTCICRAWDFSKPILFAPAMNTFMWEHPITATHINVIQSWGYEQIPPIEKVLMCKDKGLGAMAEPDTIVKKVIDTLNKR